MPLTRLQVKTKTIRNSKDPAKLEFVGYSGGPVDLSDHGFDEQAVYDLDTLKIKNQKLKMMYNHRTAIGHTTEINNSGKEVSGVGTLSVENRISKKIKNAAENQFPYEMSLGMDARKIKIDYFPEGTIANGKTFKKPTYVIRNTLVDEVTITEEGRDSNTSMRLLNSKLDKKELLTIKNSVKKPVPLERPTRIKTKKPLDLENPEERIKNMPKKTSPTPQKVTLGTALRLLNKFPDHKEVITKGLDLNWSKARILNAVKLRRLENQLPAPIKLGKAGAKDSLLFEARILNACCQDPQKTLERVYGKEIRDRVCNTPNIGVKEFLLESARRTGETSFTGHSDVGRLMNYLGRYNKAHVGTDRLSNSTGFSSFDMPNLFARITKITMDEAWLIGGFFAKEMCYKTSQSDFKKTLRFRPSGGEAWEGLDQDGKIKHTSFGDETSYETSLDTKAQMLMINRTIAKNDDFGAIKELLKLMAEGSKMVPDIKLVRRMWQANGAFFSAYAADTVTGGVGSGNDISGGTATLNETSLALAYDLASERNVSKGDINWIDQIGDNWTIVVATAALERTAWDLVNQKEFVSNTASDTKQVRDNYWYKRFAVKRYANLANKTITASAKRDAWFLWPSDPQYAPFAINWLDGVEQPTIETVDAPVDMLGFGVRGYIDVEINDRESQTIVRARPTT